MKTFYRLLLVSLVGVCSVAAQVNEAPAKYGDRVRFAEKLALVYPHFELRFVGTRSTTQRSMSGSTVPMAPYQDFVVKDLQGEQKVSWSSGTGDIGPVYFKSGEDCFSLELSQARGHGWLDKDEVVVRITQWCPDTSVAGPTP